MSRLPPVGFARVMLVLMTASAALACGARTGLESEGSPRVDSACSEQQATYAEFRDQTIEEQTAVATPCATADDCVVYRDLTGCGSACGRVLSRSARRGIEDRLYAYAERNCDEDCPPIVEQCPPPPQPVCVQGSCQ